VSVPPRTRSARPSRAPPAISSAPNHSKTPSKSTEAAAETCGRSPHGTEGPRRRSAAGQAAIAASPAAAVSACRSEPPPPAGSGLAATSRPAAPPVTRISRPATVAGRSARPVAISHAPAAANASVITHRSAAPRAARALTVLVIAL
jgi:hypothetical protein